MVGRRSHRQLPPVEVDDHDSPAGREPSRQLPQIAGGVGEVVERIHHQDDPASAGRQRAAHSLREDGVDVFDPGLSDAPPDLLDHARVHVDGVDGARRADGPGHPQRQVSRARTHVAGDVARTERQRLDDPAGHLPGLPLGVLELAQVALEVDRVAVLVVGPVYVLVTVAMLVSVSHAHRLLAFSTA